MSCGHSCKPGHKHHGVSKYTRKIHKAERRHIIVGVVDNLMEMGLSLEEACEEAGIGLWLYLKNTGDIR